jgi:hypothetical protein
MKSSFLALCLCLLVYTDLSSQNVTPQQEASLFSLQMSNQVFKVDSAFGAMVSSLTLDGYEFLVTREMVSTDYLSGATLWPAPQSEWGWANPQMLLWDHGAYDASIEGDTMRFTGMNVSVDNGDSFYFIKRFSANPEDTSYVMRYSLVNTSGKTIKKGLWELTRVPVGGLTFWPTGPGGTWGALAPKTEEVNGHTWYEREDEDGVNLKFFADGSEGWFAHVDIYGRIYVKTFEDVNQSVFASGEGEIELWVAPEYIELENQGACQLIASGAQLDYEVHWYLRQLPDSIEVTTGNPELVDYVNRLIGNGGSSSVSVETYPEQPVRVYPNPAKDFIQISTGTGNTGSCSYTLTDILGRVVMQGDVLPQIIDISGLVRGLYFIRVEGAGDPFTGRILVMEL